MPQPKDFKFTLEWKGTEYEFEHSPDGWFDYSTSWIRHRTYYGYTRGFTDTLRFIKSAADILRQAFDEKGIEALVYLKVYRLNSANWKYNLDYRGELDFTRYKDTELYGEINVFSGGTEQLLNAYDKVDYDIPIGTGYEVNVPEGVKLSETATDIIATMGAPSFNYPTHNIPLSIAGSELKTESFTFNNVEFGGFGSGNGSFVKNDDVELEMRITTKLSKSSDNPITFYMFFGTIPSEDVLYSIFLGYKATADDDVHIIGTILANEPIKTNQDVKVSFDYKLTLSNPGSYYIIGRSEYPDGENVSEYAYDYKSGSLFFEFNGSTTPFSFNALPIAEYYQRLGERMGIAEPFKSELLTVGEGKNIFVTSGDAIRGFSNAVIRDRFINLYKGTNVALNVGMGIENEGLVLEKKERFFDRDRPELNIGEVSDLQVVPATEYWTYNTVEVGYEDQTYDETNGRDEFNTLLTFTTPITKYTEKMELVSPIRADSYGVQFTKLNLEGKSTTDSSSDNKTFFIVVKETANGYEVDRDKELIDGTINPTGVFNVYLSPKRCLLRHANYLLSILQKQTGSVAFTSIAKQESNLSSQLSGEADAIVERADVPIASLYEVADPLFCPFIAKFTTKVPFNLPSQLGSNPRGYIAFSHNGVNLKGFIVQVTEKPAQRKEQEWELLLHPDTPADLLVRLRDKRGKLIR